MTVKNFLKKNKAYTSRIGIVDYHMGILNMGLKEFKYIMKQQGTNDQELLKYIVNLFELCEC